MMDISKVSLKDRKRLILLHRYSKLQKKKNSVIKSICPRCGAMRMNEDTSRNALSRQYDIQICDKCGTQEALLAMTGSDIPLSQWWAVDMFEGLGGNYE